MNVAIQAHALHIGVGDAGWQYLASLNCVLPLYQRVRSSVQHGRALPCAALAGEPSVARLQCSHPRRRQIAQLVSVQVLPWVSFRSEDV